MTKRYSGGCACGAIRYDTGAAPVFENHCQCRDCQRRSGTGHGSCLSFADRAALRIEGEAATWSVVADIGNTKHHAFCPACGTPVYLTFAAMPDVIAVAAASLDAPELFAPQIVTYASRALAWDQLDPDLPSARTMPGAEG